MDAIVMLINTRPSRSTKRSLTHSLMNGQQQSKPTVSCLLILSYKWTRCKRKAIAMPSTWYPYSTSIAPPLPLPTCFSVLAHSTNSSITPGHALSSDHQLSEPSSFVFSDNSNV